MNPIKVALLGTGLMGIPMAQRILKANLPLVVYNRTLEKTEPLQAAGAQVAASAADAVHDADCVILMLTNAKAVQAVLLSGPLQPNLSGRTVIQMGTIAPTQSKAIASAIAQAGGEYLEAPVLGSLPQAQKGELIVMVGSTPEQFERWQALLQCFGPDPRWIGPVGQAASLKLAMNQLIAALSAAFALSLGFIQRQGVEVDQFMEILRTSALYAPTFDKKLSNMLSRNFANPNFPTKHLLKDVDLFLSEATASGLETSSLQGVRYLLEQAIAQGLGEADYSALAAAVNPQEP
ncbi:MAG TPA: NAD(P)-dependent oxidoreductase [Candidatus Caenarcaniphilales bacterium]